MGSQSLRWQAWGSHESAPSPPCICYGLVCGFVRLLTVGAGVLLTHLPALETLSLLCRYLAQPWYEGFCLVSLYRVLSCLTVASWRLALFWSENGGGMEGRWGIQKEWREKKPWWGCIVWEKNLFSIFKKLQKYASIKAEQCITAKPLPSVIAVVADLSWGVFEGLAAVAQHRDT